MQLGEWGRRAVVRGTLRTVVVTALLGGALTTTVPLLVQAPSAAASAPPTCYTDPNNPGNETLPLFDVPVSSVDPNGTMSGLNPTADFCVSDPAPGVTSNGKLFVFLPGSFAVAEDYREILVQAADMGYHAIGLSYPNGGTDEANDTLGQEDLTGICGNDIGPANDTIDCWQEVRQQRFDGTPEPDGADWTDQYASLIGTPGALGAGCAGVNSIEYRLQLLLTYLKSSDPGGESSSWAPFMTGTNNCGGTPTWSDMVMSGHSQGGGEAAYIGKIEPLAGVITFDDPDDSTSTSSANESDAACVGSTADQTTVPAAWLSESGVTPISDYYEFAGCYDLGWTNDYTGGSALGLLSEGAPTSVDDESLQPLPPSPGVSHWYTTAAKPSDGSANVLSVDNHDMPVLDASTPFCAGSDDSTPFLAPVWDQLLLWAAGSTATAPWQGCQLLNPPTGLPTVPGVTSVSPATGAAAGGTTVTLTGSGFTGAESVTFGSQLASSFMVVNDSEIIATAPAHVAGSVVVQVEDATGSSPTLTEDAFTYQGSSGSSGTALAASFSPALQCDHTSVATVPPNATSATVTLSGGGGGGGGGGGSIDTGSYGANGGPGSVASGTFSLGSHSSVAVELGCGGGPGGTGSNTQPGTNYEPGVAGTGYANGGTGGGDEGGGSGGGGGGASALCFSSTTCSSANLIAEASGGGGGGGGGCFTLSNGGVGGNGAGGGTTNSVSSGTETNGSAGANGTDRATGGGAGTTTAGAAGTGYTSGSNSDTGQAGSGSTGGNGGTWPKTATSGEFPGGGGGGGGYFGGGGGGGDDCGTLLNSASGGGGGSGSGLATTSGVSISGQGGTATTCGTSLTSVGSTIDGGLGGTGGIGGASTPAAPGLAGCAGGVTLTWNIAAPTVTAVSPASGSYEGGTTVTVTGTNLLDTSAVNFGSTVVTSGISINGAGTQLTVTAPASVAGLFDVTVTTDGGTSATSTADLFTYYGSVPYSPTGVTATAGNGSVAASWTAPTDTGGSPITGYEMDVVSEDGTQSYSSIVGATENYDAMAGLTPGTSYDVTIEAINEYGTSAAADATDNPVTTPAYAPDAPTGLVATPGDGQAQLSWTAPDDNGSAIESYTATDGADDSCTTTLTTCTISGLTNGTAYAFTVTATNAVGEGAASSAVTVTPLAGVRVSVWANESSSTYGQRVQLGVEVTSKSGGAAAGVVTFSVGGVTIGEESLHAGGASLATSTLPAGADTIVATYLGSAHNLGGASSVVVTVSKAHTYLLLHPSASEVGVGGSVTIRAQVVVRTPGAGSPTGMATVALDGTVVATVRVSGGMLSASVARLTRGAHTVTVTYLGSADYYPSVASVVVHAR